MRINYKKLPVLFAILLHSIAANCQYDAIAHNKAIVTSGKDIRFTVLSPGLIRMEWDSTGNFNDAATFLVVNRKLPVPSYTITKQKGWIKIATAQLTLAYKENSGRFNAANLHITFQNDGVVKWSPDVQQRFNLKGTAKGLDHYDGNFRKDVGELVLEDGIIAKEGWTLLKDSSNLQFDNSDWPWVTNKQSPNSQDWYFMAYGSNYKQALYEFSTIAGKVPLPPRYAFGYWWSRYWAYSDNELRSLVNRFETFNIPLDVLVIDMDWHNTDSMNVGPDEFGYKKGWTGWSWNERLFPDPDNFIAWLKRKKIKTTLNLHPASGIASFETQYSDFAKRVGFDTGTRKNIPFIGSDKIFMKTYFDLLLHPIEKQGVDFWWVDWQQYQQDKKIKELPYLWWVNYTMFSDMEKNRTQRPIVFNRWGGIGNHRYQIGFSGDVIISWKSLEYQPFFTNTASNILYGYWSHDLGGHKPKADMQQIDPELQTRWLQYGVFNPIFRTHSAKSAFLNKEVWNFRGDYFQAQYEAIQLRYALAPYIYTMARKTYDSALSICRPMYYDYPRQNQAYQFNRQYMFGDDMLIAPIGAPAENGVSNITVWLPAGSDWFEWHTGTLLKGGQVLQREFLTDQYPVYIKAGAIVPMYNNAVKNLEENPENITITVFPGEKGAGVLYEDAGNDQDYQKKYATTLYDGQLINNNTYQLNIHPTQGSYTGIRKTKNYTIQLCGVAVPEKIRVNGNEISFQHFLPKENSGWRYNGKELSIEISLPAVQISDKTIIQITYQDSVKVDVNTGIKNQFKTITALSQELKYKMPKIIFPELLGALETTGIMLEYHPQQFSKLLYDFQKNYNRLPELIQQLNMDEETTAWFLKTLKLNRSNK